MNDLNLRLNPMPDLPRYGVRGADPAAKAVLEFNADWGVTMPVSLDDGPVGFPFREPLDGLATREIDEPELFHRLFG